MLITLDVSRQKKTGNIPQTYRSGEGDDMFGTCPSTCPLKCKSAKGSDKIELDYVHALVDAVPKRGQAFTYTHFHWNKWRNIGFNLPNKTTMNYSASSLAGVLKAMKAGIPTVWQEVKPKFRKLNNIKFIPCPAEIDSLKNITCATCGNGDPLCARANRNFVIVFKKKVWKKTPCYGANGYTKFTWGRTGKQSQDRSDGKKLLDWVRTLPYGSILRHHVAGDIGEYNV